MPQHLRPNSDILVTGWTASGGGSEFFSKINEGNPDDLTYIQYPGSSGTAGTLRVGLSAPAAPPRPGLLTLRIRMYTAGAGFAEFHSTILYQGDTVIGPLVGPSGLVRDAYTTYEREITAEEAAQITDWSALEVWLGLSLIQATDVVRVSWIELEVPDPHGPAVVYHIATSPIRDGHVSRSPLLDGLTLNGALT